jgi:hypothetical protein
MCLALLVSCSGFQLQPLAHRGFHLQPLTQHPLARSCHIALSEPSDDRSEEAKAEDAALAAAFNARLEKEGGATQFKIKTSLNDAADSVKGLGSKVPKVDLPSPDGVLNASPQTLIGGLFAVVVLFTVVSAGMRTGPSDTFTSDGTTLEFGKRSTEREVPLNPYRAEYGRQ